MVNVSTSIILLNYNTLSYTEQCIKSIISNTNIEYEIIVVENNSYDKEKINKLGEQYKQVTVVINEVNSGFGAGNNLGVKHAAGKYIVILNNDTVIFPHTIDNLKTILDKADSKTIITGFIEGPNGKLQHSGGKEPKILAELLRFGVLLIKHIPSKYYDNYYFFPRGISESRSIDWASGCFFAITKKFYEELNGFDENMFMYFEDVEFHKRARLAGGKIQFRPETRIKHFGNQSSKNYRDTVLKSQFKNTVYYFRKYNSKTLAILFYLLSKAIFLIWYSFFSLLVIFPMKSKIKIMDKKRMYKSLLFI